MPKLDDQHFLEALRVVGAHEAPPVTSLDETTDPIEAQPAAEPKLESARVPLPTGVTPTNIFRHPDAHPIALDVLLLRQYGPEWMVWEAETIQHLVSLEFKGQTLSDLNLAKIQACRTLHLVDTFWERWEVFGWCTVALNSEFPDFEILQVPSAAQILVGIDIASRIRDDVAWSEEIREYIKAVFRHDDIYVALPPADFIGLDTSELPFDVAAVQARWPEVRASAHPPAGGEAIDEELRRLLGAHEYLETSRDRLRQQLRILGDV